MQFLSHDITMIYLRLKNLKLVIICYCYIFQLTKLNLRFFTELEQVLKIQIYHRPRLPKKDPKAGTRPSMTTAWLLRHSSTETREKYRTTGWSRPTTYRTCWLSRKSHVGGGTAVIWCTRAHVTRYCPITTRPSARRRK